MAHRLTDLLLAAGEPVPAPAPLRQALHRGASQLLGLGRRPAGTLMTGLPALLARLAPLALQLLLRTLPRQLTTLLTRQRQIRRGRHRTVARGAIHLPLELLDPLLQPGHLLHRPRDLIQHVKQPDHQLARRFPASQRDRFRLRSIHNRKIPSAEKESCLPPRHHLNSYKSGSSDIAAALLANVSALMPCRDIIRAPSEVDPERVIERPVSSWSTLAHRILTVAEARRRQDQSACRGELVELAAEVLLLSQTPMLIEDRRSRRLRISDERDAVGACLTGD
jgi:hypothetical protein